ncbi:MAG: GAF domain-containing protein [Cyanothece sp. SIO1E1]|nr:GAF domain-containing protein [Cyanothece sp. SIO1E1]
MANNAFPWVTPLAKSLTEIYAHDLRSSGSQAEAVFSRVCQEIQDLTGCDFVAIQLINPEENLIETVYGTGISSEWSGRVKHYLEPDPDLRDIQADIVLTGNIEILSGWDNRFDRGIYNDHRHDRLVRVFIPIVLIQDKDENSKDSCFKWNIESKNESHGNRRILIQPELQISEDYLEIIGTIEVGYEDLEIQIHPEEVLSLYKFALKKAHSIYEVSSPRGLLTALVEEARQALGADSGSLHFLFNHQQGRYKYEVASTEIGRRLLKVRAPNEHGLGWQAIREKRAKFVPSINQGYQDVDEYNPEAAKEGIKAIAVFPLFINHYPSSLENQSAVGALYIHFTENRHFTQVEIDKGQLFASLLAHVLRDSMTQKQIQKQARQQRILHSIAQTLAAQIPEDGDLLKDIAWKTLNVVAADGRIQVLWEDLQPIKKG